ncbi:MAG: M23 family metallopeptidase [Bacteroidota bacterium]|nr:M23 family metallopeptidase [Bacteroidota bacterium]
MYFQKKYKATRAHNMRDCDVGGLLAMTRKGTQKYYILYIFILFSNIITAQSWMRPPIDSPLYLSGNMCALRGGHFHYGIDLPTNNTEGWPIRAVADGYVSRVNISPYGYGNALFITHYNGYVTVYAHLSKYDETIFKYILAQHYKRQSFSLDVFPQKNLLKVKKGDIIAYSGNSGGSTGPHLHFEVRDAGNMLVNPQLFLNIPDTAKPAIQNIYIVTNDYQKILLDEDNASGTETYNNHLYTLYYVPEGEIYLEAEIFDRQFFYENKLSPQDVKLYQNGKLIYHSNFKTFGFHHDKYINRHVDNTYLWDSGKYLQKLCIDKNNFAPFYDRNLGNGKMNIKVGEGQFIQIVVSDAKGNEYSGYIKLVGVEKAKKSISEDYNVFPDSITEIYDNAKTTVLKIDAGSLDFPASFYLKYADEGKFLYSSGNILIANNEGQSISFIKPASFSIPLPSIGSNVPKSKLLLAEITKNKVAVPIQTKIIEKRITGIIYHTGTYKIVSDINKPYIEFSESKNNKIIYNIADDLSGIASYSISINGKWVLAKYDVKAGKLIYDKDAYLIKAAKYNIIVYVCDHKGNCEVLQQTITEF